MQCEEMRAEWLQARYEQRAPADEIAAHIAGCAECRAFTARETGLDRVLAARAVVQPGPEFDERFFARLSTQPALPATRVTRKKARVWLFAPVVAAAAAALLFVVWPKRHVGSTAEDLAIATDLELVEALPVLEHLDEVEAFETLAHVDAEELERLGRSAP